MVDNSELPGIDAGHGAVIGMMALIQHGELDHYLARITQAVNKRMATAEFRHYRAAPTMADVILGPKQEEPMESPPEDHGGVRPVWPPRQHQEPRGERPEHSGPPQGQRRLLGAQEARDGALRRLTEWRRTHGGRD